MLDYDDGRAVVQKRLKNAQQHPHVQRMQADGRLVEHENRVLLRFADLACQLQTLRLAAGEAWRLLAQREVAKAKLLQNVQPLTNGFHIPAKLDGGGYVHIHQLRQGNARAGPSCKLDAVCRPRVTGAAAVRAGDVDVRQELHVQTDDACSVAAGTAQGTGVV